MHYNYKLNENILKILIQRNILLNEPNTKINLIIYYNKFKISNLVIENNSLPRLEFYKKTNVMYQSKCSLEYCISGTNHIYVGSTLTTLSRRLTMHLIDTSSKEQRLKKHSYLTTEFRKILTKNTILEQQKLLILEALHIRNIHVNLIELILKLVRMYLDVSSYWCYS